MTQSMSIGYQHFSPNVEEYIYLTEKNILDFHIFPIENKY